MSNIKRCFTSRFGSDGSILNADFSQIEIIGLAYLSQDEQLYQDIRDGLDMHCINASFLYSKPYDYIKAQVEAGDKDWVKKRKIAKSPGFLIQYGGGVKAMALQTGLPESQCKTFIENYYLRYPQVKAWQESVMEEVKSTRKPSSRRTDSKKTAGMGYYKSITGRRYVFFEFDNDYYNPKRKGDSPTSFSPTQMKNYPVQGFATGDIVSLVLGKLYRVLKNRHPDLNDKALLINTVHDSIMLDVHNSVVEEVAILVKEIMENAPKYIEEVFGLTFDLPLKVDVEWGPNWMEQTEKL